MTDVRQKRVKDWFSKHYFELLTWFAIIYSIFGIPFQLYLIGDIVWLSRLLALLFVVLPMMLSVFFMNRTIVTNPHAFMKILHTHKYHQYFFWSVSIVAILLWGLFVVNLTNLQPNSILLNAHFVFTLTVFTYLSVGAALFEAPVLGLSVGMLLTKNTGKYFKLQAKACFRIAANAISTSCNKKEIAYFKNGIQYLNGYLELKYGAQLLKGKEYVNYFKTVAFVGTDIEKQIVKEAVDGLEDKLEGNIELADVLVSVRDIYGKTEEYEKPVEYALAEKYSELDYDLGNKSWVFEHRDTVTLIFTMISTIIAIVSLFLSIWKL